MLATDVGRLPVPTGAVDGLSALWTRAIQEAGAAIGWLRRARCGLGGHELVRHFEPGRMALECISCGQQTAGWQIDGSHR